MRIKSIQLPLILLTFFLCTTIGYANNPKKDIALASNPDYAGIRQAADRISDSERFQQLLLIDWETRLAEYPEYATFTGFPGNEGKWTNYSRGAIERRHQLDAERLAAVQSIERRNLEPAQQISYDLLLDESLDTVEGNAFPFEFLAVTQLDGVQSSPAQVLQTARADSKSALEDQLSRLKALPALIEQSIALLEEGRSQGITPPRVTLRDVPGQVQNQIVDDPTESPLLASFLRRSASVQSEDHNRLKDVAYSVYTDSIRTAYQRLLTYLEETYISAARESIAISALPDGEAWYAYLVKHHTSTDLTPREIHNLGLSEVKRIRAEMEILKEQVKFEGDMDAFFTFLRTDPQFYYANEEDLLMGYRDIAKRIDAELPKLFGTLPRLPYGVKAVPEHDEKSQTTAYYMPGSNLGARAGIFYANTYALHTRPKWEMEALTVHEAVPGHHLQISLAQELEDVPNFRKYNWGYTAFVEGWGLYSESLGEEVGLYTDPYMKFGQCTYEMWRAIRLVVDTGMHAFGWSRQEAIDYFKANSSKSEHDITVEIDRYITWPGQALAYKIGELKIKELRDYAAEVLGEAFDIRDFHDAVLGKGALPLSVLETGIREWVELKKGEGENTLL